MPEPTPIDATVAETIRQRAFTTLPAVVAGRTHLALSEVVYPAGYEFPVVDRVITAPRESALVFVDEMPGANWGHPCRYQFYDPTTTELVHEEGALFPPDLHPAAARLAEFHTPLARFVTPFPLEAQRRIDWTKIYEIPFLTLDGAEERYAVLWTSQISNRRHVEDLEFCYRTLRDVYGFAPSNIRVLCYDGTLGAVDFDPLGNYVGDDTAYRMPVDFSATQANLQSALTDLGSRMTSESLLFIHTNNHGSPSGLCIDSGSVVTPTDFGTMIAGLPAIDALVVTMEQCYSGAFQQPVIDNSMAARTVFASAVPSTKVSAGGTHYDPWAQHLIEGLTGGTAYGASLPSDPDSNNNGRVSMKEACDYAAAQNMTYDDPQYADSPAGCGSDVWLGRVHQTPGWWHHLLDGLQERVPLVIPDPGPIELRGPVEVAQEQIAQHLVGLAKSLTPANRSEITLPTQQQIRERIG